MGKAYWYMAALIVSAAVVTIVVGGPGLDLIKAAGILLAALTVLPVFALLVRAIRSGDSKRVLKTFVGGFLFKLIVLIVGVWWGVSRAGWDVTRFTVSCLSFVFAFQVCESIYFWAYREILSKDNSA